MSCAKGSRTRSGPRGGRGRTRGRTSRSARRSGSGAWHRGLHWRHARTHEEGLVAGGHSSRGSGRGPAAAHAEAILGFVSRTALRTDVVSHCTYQFISPPRHPVGEECVVLGEASPSYHSARNRRTRRLPDFNERPCPSQGPGHTGIQGRPPCGSGRGDSGLKPAPPIRADGRILRAQGADSNPEAAQPRLGRP
jgi:hypothetical protein